MIKWLGRSHSKNIILIVLLWLTAVVQWLILRTFLLTLIPVVQRSFGLLLNFLLKILLLQREDIVLTGRGDVFIAEVEDLVV